MAHSSRSARDSQVLAMTVSKSTVKTRHLRSAPKPQMLTFIALLPGSVSKPGRSSQPTHALTNRSKDLVTPTHLLLTNVHRLRWNVACAKLVLTMKGLIQSAQVSSTCESYVVVRELVLVPATTLIRGKLDCFGRSGVRRHSDEQSALICDLIVVWPVQRLQHSQIHTSNTIRRGRFRPFKPCPACLDENKGSVDAAHLVPAVAAVTAHVHVGVGDLQRIRHVSCRKRRQSPSLKNSVLRFGAVSQ